MSSSKLQLTIDDVDRIAKAIQMYPPNAESVINDVLYEQAGPMIMDSIMQYLPESHRQWKGKKKSAKNAQPFSQANGNLSITIRTKQAYNYLYFPDDGSNTLNHYGNQQFMVRGAEARKDEIVDYIIGRLAGDTFIEVFGTSPFD